MTHETQTIPLGSGHTSEALQRARAWLEARGVEPAEALALLVTVELLAPDATSLELDAEGARVWTDAPNEPALARYAQLLEVTRGEGWVALRPRSEPVEPPALDAPRRSIEASVLDRLLGREADIDRLQRELDETNRGVVALYAELDEHSRDLERADRRKDEFLAMLAHELRNPLAALRIAAEDLEDGGGPRAVAVIQRQMQHLGRMVDDLLDVSRITRGKIEVSLRRIELSQAVHQAVEPRRRIAAASRMNLVVEEAPAPLWIDGDPTRVEQVIVNLVDNAIKYGVPGGTVTVSLGLQDNQAELAVKDDGRGMTDEQLRDAFELFVQHALDGLDRPRGGLGLGLTLVREIVTLHGGSVSADSDGPGEGSVFRVCFPVVDAPATTPEPVSQASEDSDGAMRLLLVEDNEDFRELLASRLRRRGLEVLEAGDGAQALAHLRAAPLPDAVVTDVGLPGMDGYALARAIRSDQRLEPLKLIALTGYGGQDALERTRLAGFDDHLVKPVPVEELLAALRS